MSESPAVRVCVAIPTFRRPRLLEALLGGIASLSIPAGHSIEVVVIDNDSQPSARPLVEATASSFPFALKYVNAVEPGLSSVRNVALDYASSRFDFLAMIDDDERPEPQWLGELLRVQRSTGADGVVGAVPARLPDDAPRWVRVGNFHDLPSFPDGASIAFGYSGNCLLRVSSLTELGVRFDSALNFAGGEDLLFFRQLLARGAKLAYAAQAIAPEEIGRARTRASYLIKLHFRRGNTLSICDRRLRGSVAALTLRAAKSCARFALGAACILPLTCSRGRAGAVRALCDMAQGLGGIYGLLGRVYLAYGREAASSGAESAWIAGVRIDNAGFERVIERIVAHAAADGESGYVVTPNAHHVVLHQTDSRLREIYEGAFLVVPDGVPLLWAARLLGEKLSGRVNGTDLLETLCARAAEGGLRVYFLGGREGAATAAAARLLARHPSLQICGTYCPPFGFERDAEEEARIVARIRAARPHLLFVGLGAPKQEYWMYAHREALRVPVSLGIGVSFELVGGIVKRAPVWMQRSGLEWLFRLVAEPKRLWKRYVLGNARFCALVARDYFARTS